MRKPRLKHGRMVCPSNLEWVKTQPCLMSGQYGVDPCHYPLRRSQGGSDGLLNLIPLTRYWHDKLDNHKMTPNEEHILEELAILYFIRVCGIMCETHWLGPDERIAEVKGWI